MDAQAIALYLGPKSVIEPKKLEMPTQFATRPEEISKKCASCECHLSQVLVPASFCRLQVEANATANATLRRQMFLLLSLLAETRMFAPAPPPPLGGNDRATSPHERSSASRPWRTNFQCMLGELLGAIAMIAKCAEALAI